MEYLLDTANLEQIRELNDTLPISGVTSNPSIVKKEGKIPFWKHMNEIRKIIGPEKSLHIQVTSTSFKEMMADAERILKKVDENVFIKVPVDMEGLKVIRALKAMNVHVTATCLYTVTQGFLAIEAGADYLAPYYNRMANMSIDPSEVISSYASMIEREGSSTKILAASFKNIGQVNDAFLSGAQAATMPPELLVQALGMPAISSAVADFNADWKSLYGGKSLYEM